MSPAPKPRTRGWIIAGLLALAAVPVVAGASRLAELAGGATVTADNARFLAAPAPVAIHIVAASLFGVLGAFQFAPGLRRRTSGWHRRAGRLLVVCGLLVAGTGLWMTLSYPNPPGDGDALFVLRLLFGAAMAASIALSLRAIGRRDFAEHGAWMTRAYAIGMGAGTQVLTHLPYFILVGKPGEVPRALLMAAGWLINVAVAEQSIRRAARPQSGGRLAARTAAAVEGA